MITSGLFTSNTPEWATPQKVFDELDAEFHFTLDPCSTHENAKCEKHYTIEDDGLSQNWGGKWFSAIHHTAKSCQNGLKRAMMKQCLMMLQLLCLSHLERTQHGFTLTSMARPR